MSESDTMFNERYRRCSTVQRCSLLIQVITNRTIASTLKMQIWIATNNRDVPRVMKTKLPATLMVFGVVSSDGHIMPPHLRSRLESQHQSVPGCAEECGDPQVQSGGRQQYTTPAHKSKETQSWLQKECYDFVPFSHWPPPPST